MTFGSLSQFHVCLLQGQCLFSIVSLQCLSRGLLCDCENRFWNRWIVFSTTPDSAPGPGGAASRWQSGAASRSVHIHSAAAMQQRAWQHEYCEGMPHIQHRIISFVNFYSHSFKYSLSVEDDRTESEQCNAMLLVHIIFRLSTLHWV